MSQLTNVFIGVGASLVFTSALFMYFGYFAKAKRVSDTALNHPTTSVTVTPQVYKGGGGLLTTLRF